MIDQSNILQLILSLLSLLMGLLSIVGLIVAGRAIFKARREAYEIAHRDFVDLKERVRKELRKED